MSGQGAGDGQIFALPLADLDLFDATAHTAESICT